MRKLVCFTLLCFLLLLALPALAQEATVVGTVTDSTGAAVPNVKITLTNIETGQVRTLTTNEVGQYIAPGLHIGHYTVRAEGAGFKVAERKDLVLNVGDRDRVDIQLQIGQTQETVTVEATGITVQADTGEVSQVITGQQVSQLATNGRSIYTLVNLTPGASSLQGDFQVPTPVGGDANVSFNGQRMSHNIYLLDGGEDLDRGGAGTFSVQPSMDSIAEFRALTSNYSAEYGLSSAATFTTVLKSGTKQFHASAWEFNRNDAMQARNYFQTTKPKLRFNTYGFNGGGPVDFWKSDHKTFFFYNMEWRKLIQGGSSNQVVPPTSVYGGNLAAAPTSVHAPCVSQLSTAQQTAFANAGQSLSTCDAAGKVVTAVPFNNNQIPASLLSANAQALLKAGIFPAPSGSDNHFRGGNDSPTDVREEIVRIDHRFNDKLSIFGHFIAEQISQTFGTTMWSGDNVPTIGNTFGNPSYSGVVHLTHTISPRLLNEIAFNYNGNRIAIIPKGTVAAPSDFTFNRVFTGPNDLNRIPTINLSSTTGAQYSANWTPWNNVADSYQIKDDISWSHGAHNFKFGGSWQLYKKVQDVFASTQGNFNFNGFYTGYDFADFLLGYANTYQEDALKDAGHWNAQSWALYFQDDWRVNNRLTLNLGLRWDGIPHTYEANHRTTNFYPNQYNPANAATFDNSGAICVAAGNGCTGPSPGLGTSPSPVLAGLQFYLNGIGYDGLGNTPKGLVENHWATFGPRLGFAYDLTGSGKTVVRGGFGVMYERIQGNDMYNAGTNPPYSGNANFSNVLLSNPRISVANGSTQSLSAVPILSITGLNSDMYFPTTSYQYSFGVQREMWANSVLSVSYVGNQNRKLSDFREVNLPPLALLSQLVANNGSLNDGTGYNQTVQYLGYRGIRLAENAADGHYNSLQVSFRAQANRDLTLQTGYTVSKAMDPSTGNGNGYDLNNVSNPYVGWRYDWGPSFFDRRQVLFVNFVYDIPVFRHSDSRALRSIVGGWQLSGIVTAQTGAPLNITTSNTSAGSVVQNSINRPDVVGSISYPHTVDHWFSASAFAMPAAGQWGNMERGSVYGPGRHNWNLSLFKSFVMSESRGSRIELRAETFNFWNHTQFRGDAQGGGISTNFNSNNFGQVTSAYDPRTLQLAVKVIF